MVLYAGSQSLIVVVLTCICKTDDVSKKTGEDNKLGLEPRLMVLYSVQYFLIRWRLVCYSCISYFQLSCTAYCNNVHILSVVIILCFLEDSVRDFIS